MNAKLDNETLVSLVGKAQQGDVEARNRVVEANLRFVYAIARKLGREFGQADREDFQSAGMLGLLRAVQTWNPKSGTAWSTHAFWKIRNRIMNERLWVDGVKPSPTHRKIATRINKVESARKAQGLSCTPQDLADAIGVKVGTVEEYLSRRVNTVRSLQFDPNSFDYPQPMVEHQDQAQQDLWSARLKSYAQGIGGIQGEILKARLAEIPLTEVAKKFGITKQKIHDLDKQVLRRARFDLQDLREEDR